MIRNADFWRSPSPQPQVRKIRCDALPEGCSHCINQNLDCNVTDRVTGRTERRGYMQQLEREKNDMVSRIRSLERLLTDTGVDVREWQRGDPAAVLDAAGNPITELPSAGAGGSGSGGAGGRQRTAAWSPSPSTGWLKDAASKLPQSLISQTIPEPEPVDAHMGVRMDFEPLSSIKGTTLSILGSTIDIGAFGAADTEDAEPGQPLYNRSLRAMMQTSMNVNPKLSVDYPPKSDAFTYAEWYFLMIHPFIPVLHKPSFMALLNRLYGDPTFLPTAAESVTVHLVYAQIYMQYGIRQESADQKERLHDMSIKHYHAGLGRFFDLTVSRTFDDVQALAMLATYTSRFPKSDVSSFVSQHALNLAIELGMHRALRRHGEPTNLANEMRKRVWWTLMKVAIQLNGHMGRPMPIRLEETNVDFPEMIADELITDEGVITTKTARCAYEIGVVAMKIASLYLELYANVYCAKRDPKRYVPVVEALEEQIQLWEDGLPESLRMGDVARGEGEGHLFAMYARLLRLELRLLLRHPSVALTDDPQILASSRQECDESAKEMLLIAHNLYRLKCLDSTWYSLATFISATFTMLVSAWERRLEITGPEVQTLRKDMNVWLLVINEVGTMMGCGTGPRDAVSAIIERTLAWIDHDHLYKTNNAAPPLQIPSPTHAHAGAGAIVSIGQPPHTPPYTAGRGTTPNPLDGAAVQHYFAAAAATTPPDSATTSFQPHHPQQPLAVYAEPQHHPATTMSYDPSGTQFLYSAPAVATLPSQAPPPPPHQQQQHMPASPPDSNNPLQSYHHGSQGGNTWQQWTTSIIDQPERYGASALMSLGASSRDGGHHGHVGRGSPAAAPMPHQAAAAAAMEAEASMQWPLIIFGDGSGMNHGMGCS